MLNTEVYSKRMNELFAEIRRLGLGNNADECARLIRLLNFMDGHGYNIWGNENVGYWFGRKDHADMYVYFHWGFLQECTLVHLARTTNDVYVNCYGQVYRGRQVRNEYDLTTARGVQPLYFIDVRVGDRGYGFGPAC